ncbi:DUF2264 domain-containing protein [Humibacter ginsenosidimutans]|uniref:DUF2264 domain-containing protein n=1 Tax=Humibacter ginsenosidimutans TaxID=2599293 RepID=A0A5B8M4V3_9MICO|nr:DUF2264 domain-containing protein [Humibacter ginsenosidimutans]QDZ15376.1 DUF2264 domain-containing protein [Humibacter ginsenosidimutans]
MNTRIQTEQDERVAVRRRGAPSAGLVLPGDDSTLSPFTGWTRAHWTAVADHWLDEVRSYSSPEGAMTRLPGRVTEDGVRRECMETVGRSFLLAAPRIAGAEDTAVESHLEWYSRALLAGTRPDGSESWPSGVACRTPLSGVTNSLVEAANISFGLYITRDKLWERLSRAEQRQLSSWLLHHARLEAWQSNWQLFPAMAEAFLRSVGEDVSGTTGTRNVARVESWYLGDGWYTDGPERSIDYYNAWAIHPYLWAWYRMTEQTQTAEGERHLERLAQFVSSFARFVAPDGSVLHIGRSLTYRTAVLAALWCAEISDVNPLSHGATRRLASGVLARFTKKGVGVEGPLSLGWYAPFEPMCQAYSGFGSPYLAGIGFLGLALPGDAPLWTAQEEAKPTETGPAAAAAFVEGMPSTGWVLASPADGVVRLINHGSDHTWIPVGDDVDADDPHYAKFAYSTHTAPGTGGAWVDDVDSHIALLDDDGNASRRSALRGSRVEGEIAGSVHLPQLNRSLLPGCAITTVSFVHDELEVRAHLVEAPSNRRVREGGFAVADAAPPVSGVGSDHAWARGEAGIMAACIGLHGWSEASVFRYDGANAMADHSATPALFGRCRPGLSVFVALHALTRSNASSSFGEDDVARWRDSVDVHVDGTRVTVLWEGGSPIDCDLATFVPWDHHTGPKAANL